MQESGLDGPLFEDVKVAETDFVADDCKQRSAGQPWHELPRIPKIGRK